MGKSGIGPIKRTKKRGDGVELKTTTHPVARSEASIERAFVRWCNDRSIITRKLNGPGYRGWPDRMVILKNGIVLFIEFKRPGGKLTPSQRSLHELLKSYANITVYVCDNLWYATSVVERSLDLRMEIHSEVAA